MADHAAEKDAVEHRLLNPPWPARCTCGWAPPLGTSVRREFDKHLLDVADKAEQGHIPFRLHPDWPALDAGIGTYSMPDPYGDVASACEAYGSGIRFHDIATVTDYLIEGNGGRWTPERPVNPGSELAIVLLGTLRDGRWFALEGWNDYTGWGCQDNVDTFIGASREDAIRNGLTVEGRHHLGLSNPPGKGQSDA
ncbi:MAG: hypothetical protein HOV66_19740 [Streptomycetaceae bacterium]|nr:hypothetical protein [Streptomycetaceae bacterium]